MKKFFIYLFTAVGIILIFTVFGILDEENIVSLGIVISFVAVLLIVILLFLINNKLAKLLELKTRKKEEAMPQKELKAKKDDIYV